MGATTYILNKDVRIQRTEYRTMGRHKICSIESHMRLWPKTCY